MSRPQPRPHIHGGIQFFSIVLFAAFAISTSIVALNAFWPAGIALAAFYAWQWARIPTLSGGLVPMGEAVEAVRPSVPDTADRPTGNATFDAYKAELMVRLEKEQANFENFLTRLRASKDKAEFDAFMEDRARAARAATGADLGTAAPPPMAGGPALREPA